MRKNGGKKVLAMMWRKWREEMAVMAVDIMAGETVAGKCTLECTAEIVTTRFECTSTRQ